MDGLSDRTAGRRLGARLRAAAAFAVAACLVWACACVGSGYAARGGGAENVGTRERFLFQPTHTEPRVADGELCCTGNASSRAAYAAVLQRDANDFNAAKGLLVFSAGTEDVTVRGSQDGDTDSCACNVAVVSTKDTRNHPYVLARFTPYSTYAKAPLDPFMFGVVLDRVRITSGDHNSVGTFHSMNS
ncbi:hypothetical protein FVE85_8859 [Porphyridium purpureum]|uniref:Uncharacterized protein n=1 Tax=Porphyridium purpureum TaxID=35688 RepID=A0A5J4YRQ6_PORPP|nr:hypothetical protein FVE85_8859 [Porphyridium purpureum]|eukprot:POR8912..scf296_7